MDLLRRVRGFVTSQLPVTCPSSRRFSTYGREATAYVQASAKGRRGRVIAAYKLPATRAIQVLVAFYLREIFMPKDINQLVNCHVCSGQVSKKAKTCPHCGQKNPAKKPQGISKPLAWIVILITIVTIIDMIGNKNQPMVLKVQDAGAYPERKSQELCIDGIKSSVNNPSTLDISYVLGYATDLANSTTRRIVQEFSAQNAFGLRKKFTAYCMISKDGKLEIDIREQK